MSDATPDVIDLLAGLEAGSTLDGVRAQRIQARDNAQLSYLALFHPDDTREMSATERHAVAAFVAGLHGQAAIAGFYAEGLADAPAIAASVEAEAASGRTHGPYGSFPPGKLSAEDIGGPVYQVTDAGRAALGTRLSAAFEHAHMLVFHLRDADPSALQALLDAGWSTTGIVTLSQLVAFLAFQIRVIAGLRALAAAPAGGRP